MTTTSHDLRPIPPDTKDWTWVLQRACPECGFDAGAVPTAELVDRFADNAAAWTGLLVGPLEGLRTRPRPDRWSTLEYACHVRDVLALAEERIALMRGAEDPLFANWDQDATAMAAGYAEQDPMAVADALADRAAGLAATLDALDEEGWARTGRRSDGAAFTVTSFSRYVLHDVVHHVHDVTAASPPAAADR